MAFDSTKVRDDEIDDMAGLEFAGFVIEYYPNNGTDLLFSEFRIQGHYFIGYV